jgi:hypothetical protein
MQAFSNIVVDSENHGYSINNKSLISATTLVSRLKPDFDKDGISKRVAQRDGVSQEEILRQWEKKGEQGRDRGTRLHTYIEDLMIEKIDPITRAINERLPSMNAFDKAWEKMTSKLKAKLLHQEIVVGDEQYCTAGRVDAIFEIEVKQMKSTHIFDWKTGKFRIDNQYEKLLPPFDDVDICELNAYSIQLSLYRLIIEKNTNLKFGESYLVHLTDDGPYMMHRARDFRSRLHEWLKDGLPQSFVGDASADKKVSDVCKILGAIDVKLLQKASHKNRRVFDGACKKISNMLRMLDFGDDDV